MPVTTRSTTPPLDATTASPLARTCPRCAAPVSPRAESCALCDATLAPLPAAAPASRRAWMPSVGSIARPVAHAVVRLVVVAYILCVLAALTVAGLVSRNHANFAERMEDLRVVAKPIPSDEIERTLARSASFDGRGTRPDYVAARMLASAGFVGDPELRKMPNRYSAVDMTPLAALVDPVVRRPQPEGNVLLKTIHGAPVKLSDSVRAIFARDTATPWLYTWRKVAASGELPRLWFYRADFGEATSAAGLPIPRFAGTKELAWRNAEAGLLALDAGDVRTAERRARENMAVGFAHFRSPVFGQSLLGRGLVGEGAQLLAYIGRSARRPELVTEGESVLALLKAQRMRLEGSFVALARDPDAPRAVAFASDVRNLPSARLAAARAIVAGSCASAGELLMGPDARRRAAIERAAAGLADLDPHHPLAPLLLGEYDGFVDRGVGDGVLRLREIAPLQGSMRVLQFAGFGGLMHRVQMCGL